MVARLYEDLLAEKITESTFETMMAKTQNEQEQLKQQIQTYELGEEEEEKSAVSAKKWLDLIKEYASVTELDSEMLNRLIKQIVVNEEIAPDGTRNISLKIHYNFRPVDDSNRHMITNNTGEDSSSLGF